MSPCCCMAASLTSFPERPIGHPTSLLGPVSGQGAQGFAKGRHDDLDQDTWASVLAPELSSWASVWLFSSWSQRETTFSPKAL